MTDQRETDDPQNKPDPPQRGLRFFLQMIAVLAIAGMLAILFASKPKAGEYEPFNQGTGVILTGSTACFNSEINSDVIRLLESYQEVLDAFADFNRGVGPSLTPDMKIFGDSVFYSNLCSAVRHTYQVFLLRRGQGHVLLRFTDVEGPSFVAAEIDFLVDADDPETL